MASLWRDAQRAADWLAAFAATLSTTVSAL
jgi:hypothetical protein